MTRMTLTLAACISFSSALSASLTPRPESPLALRKNFPALTKGVLLGKALKLSALVPEQGTGEAPRSEFVVTSETVTLLNGKRCSYKEIPDHATIVHMEVAEDKKTVLKIHFRTRK